MLFSELHTKYINTLWSEYRIFKRYDWWSVTASLQEFKENEQIYSQN